jgi:hypothetical protein
MRKRVIFAAIIGLVVAFAALGSAWYLTQDEPPQYCQLSGRLIHPHMLTVVRVQGKKLYACCARCALTNERQTGIHVEVVQVTDYISGRRIDARKAWFVDGSHREPCASPAMKPDAEGTPSMRMFDRCSPSLIAFSRQDQALNFITANSGKLTTLNDLEVQAKAENHGVSK